MVRVVEGVAAEEAVAEEDVVVVEGVVVAVAASVEAVRDHSVVAVAACDHRLAVTARHQCRLLREAVPRVP
jgi:hypothetical protein